MAGWPGRPDPALAFPPRLGNFGWMAALMHANLRLRFAHLEEVVSDHHESTFSPEYEAS